MIEAGINALLTGDSLTGVTGQPATATYTFDLPTWKYGSENWVEGASNYQLLNNAQQTAAREAFALWESVANVTFTESNLGDGTDIVLRQADFDNPNIAGWALPFTYTGTTELAKQDILYASDYMANPAQGSHAFMVMMHEIGHALGLEDVSVHNHAGSFVDSWDATIMSYNAGDNVAYGSYAITPMLYDIAAVQALYGANHSYNAGDTTYTFDGSGVSLALWDGAGTDTLDVQNFSSNLTLDLREGLEHVSHIGSSNVWVAFGANIEQAFSGAGNDTITGNALNNGLLGGEGNDTILGNAGDDVMNGNAGADTVQGGSGNDNIRGGQDTDRIEGGTGNDVMNGNLGMDFVFGDDGDDTLHGGQDDDHIHGGNGNDQLFGDKGNDRLFGNNGIDKLRGGGGVDQFVFTTLGESTDDAMDQILDFTAGVDVIDLALTGILGMDQLELTQLADQLVVSDSSSSFAITLMGVESLTGGDFIFAA